MAIDCKVTAACQLLWPTASSSVCHFLMFSRFPLVLPQLRNLNVLDLRHISELNNETVMEVVRKCRNLSSLNLCLNWSINDRLVNQCGGLLYSQCGDTMQVTQPLRGFRKGWWSEYSLPQSAPTLLLTLPDNMFELPYIKHEKENLPAHIHELDGTG